MTQTNYGEKQQRNSKFVIVAPHAAGDDIRTEDITKNIAHLLNASFVINYRYRKPNKHRVSIQQYVENFNRLPWSDKNKCYMWVNKNTRMKEFYDDINILARYGRSYGHGRAIVIYIHGLKSNKKPIGIDIGFGVKYYKGKLKGARGKCRHPNAKNYTGVVRAKIKDMTLLKNILEIHLKKDYSLTVEIGKVYAAWDRKNGVQYHAGTPDYSFQLEILSSLRKLQKVKYTARLIAYALNKVYS